MIEIIAEHIFFIFMLFIIASLVSSKVNDDKPMELIEIVKFWIILVVTIYSWLLILYFIVMMGGHLTI